MGLSMDEHIVLSEHVQHQWFKRASGGKEALIDFLEGASIVTKRRKWVPIQSDRYMGSFKDLKSRSKDTNEKLNRNKRRTSEAGPSSMKRDKTFYAYNHLYPGTCVVVVKEGEENVAITVLTKGMRKPQWRK